MLQKTSIQFKMSAAMAVVTLAACATYAIVLLNARKDAVIKEADQKLLVAAESARAVLGPQYHDRIFDKASVPAEEFSRIVATYDQLCRKTGMQYIWSVMVLDGRIVFTSATHSVLTDPGSACATFLEEHTTPWVYERAFATMEPDYSTFDNKWGRGRMLLIPALDKHGRKHIFASSVRLEELSGVIHRTVVESVIMSVGIALGAILVSLPVARAIARPIVQLTEASQRMAGGDLGVQLAAGGAREVVVLAESLESMRKAIRGQMEALRESQKRFASLADHNQRLVRELEHRVQNHIAGLLGLMGAMKTRTRDVEAFATAIETRLRAMAHVQRLLSDTKWEPVDLRRLITSTLEAMASMAKHANPVEVEGSAVLLSAEQAMPLTLVLVEWFTNSCKYGAHSLAGGALSIRWESKQNGAGRVLHFAWEERGGPRIGQPVTPSLGTQLVEAFVTRELHGRCGMTFPSEGARHKVEFVHGE